MNKITATFDGVVNEYDVILTFHNDDNDKDYIVYTDNTYDKYDKLKIYASIYNVKNNQVLGNPETDEEWHRIYSLLDEVL